MANDAPDDTYPSGTFGILAGSEFVTDPTRRALRERSQPRADDMPPEMFSDAEWTALAAVCGTLVPSRTHPSPTLLAHLVAQRLGSGKGNGWRYDTLPADEDAYRFALRGLNTAAQAQFGKDSFMLLDDEQRRALLEQWRDGSLPFAGLTEPSRVFEELLAEIVELYTSFPQVLDEMGYAGYADAKGWPRIGLDVVEAWEPKAGVLPVLPVVAPPAVSVPSLTGKRDNPSFGDECDVVIVGTGAGGAPLLARFARAGLRVVALEAGKWFDPARDFASDEREQAKIFWNDERLSAGGSPISFGSNNSGCGVGGSTLHFTAYTPRPHPDDFRFHTDFGVGADWPIGYDDLEPYLTEAEQFLGISGPATYPWGGHRSEGYALPSIPLNGPALLMERGCRSLGIRTSPAPNAALSQPRFQEGVGWRPACTYRGFCQAGCSVGAKASMDVTYLPFALAYGAEIRPECFVTQIETHPADRTQVTGVVYVGPDGAERRLRCRALFLCAGAVESPRLLLLNNLGNDNGQVGRHFTVHTGVQLWGQFDDDVRPTKGIPGGLISEDTHRPKDADFAGGYLLQSIGVMPVTYASQWARAEKVFGDAIADHLRGFNHIAGINILGDCLPYAHNFLELSDEKDARGLPKPRIHFTPGENEKRLEAHSLKIMNAIWQAAGVRREVWSLRRYAHTLGTCRMGSDPATSVIDADHRVHGMQNLYISDNGIYASSLAVNPLLTQVALSLRCADRFLASKEKAS